MITRQQTIDKPQPSHDDRLGPLTSNIINFFLLCKFGKVFNNSTSNHPGQMTPFTSCHAISWSFLRFKVLVHSGSN